MKISKEEFAAKLDGRQYRDELNRAEELEAKDNNLVIVFGGSDDLMEFRGAINDEIGAWDGGKGIIVPVGGKYEVPSEEDEEIIITRQPLMKPAVFDVPDNTPVKGNIVEAVWCPEDEEGEVKASWEYKTEIPHSVFKIVEDDDVYCFGIVFSMNDVKL